MQIIAFGDTILENNFFKSESYENFIELFSKADLVTYNLETVVSDRTLMENDKAVCFKIMSILLSLVIAAYYGLPKAWLYRHN